jgi:hypothetical protein
MRRLRSRALDYRQAAMYSWLLLAVTNPIIRWVSSR